MPDIFISDKTKKERPKKKRHSFEKRGKKRKDYLAHSLIKGDKGPLTSFNYLPKKVNFESKEKEERIILLLREHPIVNLSWIAVGIVMALAPLVLKRFPFISFLPSEFQLIVVLGWYLITMAYLLEKFLMWFFNVNIITDERIIDIDFVNLIYKQISDTNIDKIQDVTYRMGGAIRTLFNYGDVLIQTAGEVPNFDFIGVPQPDKIAKILQELRIEEEKEKIEGRIR